MNALRLVSDLETKRSNWKDQESQHPKEELYTIQGHRASGPEEDYQVDTIEDSSRRENEHADRAALPPYGQPLDPYKNAQDSFFDKLSSETKKNRPSDQDVDRYYVSVLKEDPRIRRASKGMNSSEQMNLSQGEFPRFPTQGLRTSVAPDRGGIQQPQLLFVSS